MFFGIIFFCTAFEMNCQTTAMYVAQILEPFILLVGSSKRKVCVMVRCVLASKCRPFNPRRAWQQQAIQLHL